MTREDFFKTLPHTKCVAPVTITENLSGTAIYPLYNWFVLIHICRTV